MRKKHGRLHVGTSGWHYAAWRGDFYPADLPADGMLAWYCRHFAAVELNNTFYRMPEPSAVERWRDTVPPGFVFAVKGSRFTTHMKKLKDPPGCFERFMARIAPLEARLGPILYQLPPGWPCDPPRLQAFLEALPRQHRYAFELRDPSWHTDAVLELLHQHRAAFCIFDLGGQRSPLEVTTDLVYVRLHGPDRRRYHGSYDDRALGEWASRCQSWLAEGRQVHLYFDNDVGGHAPRDAARLQALCRPTLGAHGHLGRRQSRQ
jgi:uncharacterized protein YecE (DUF72 family)